MYLRSCFFLLLICSLLSSCYKEQVIPVLIDFDYVVAEESFTVPVKLTIFNNTTGADFYNWTFEGASPGSSTKKQPGEITYSKAGTYTIRLEAWNDTERSFHEIEVVLDSAVTLDFDVDVLVNDFVPATVQFTNHTRGASSYEWTFHGGIPEKSTLANPPTVLFNTPGEHVIGLKVSNGREFYSSSKTITLKDALAVEFEIVPSFEDEDYEAPLTASLSNKTVSGLRYTWSATGGTITDPSSENPDIYFPSPGEYTVKLSVENDKETKFIEHNIVVKPNTNLYTMSDVKLGVSAAHATVGCFYSTRLRKVINKQEVTAANGERIDLVFYGINSAFSYCRFVSPDSASRFTYSPIPQASHTFFVNTLQTSTLSFSSAEFDNMTNDSPLAGLDIKGADSGIQFFNGSVVPYIVLFETDDGRKGAIKIKSFASEGTQSYIIVDIKVQKLKQ